MSLYRFLPVVSQTLDERVALKPVLLGIRLLGFLKFGTMILVQKKKTLVRTELEGKFSFVQKIGKMGTKWIKHLGQVGQKKVFFAFF